VADIRQQAVATAAGYQEGDIASLDDATTRRLIASTVMAQSRGGDPETVHRHGYAGRYRAGAEFLAEAGYVDRDKLDQAMSGHRSEAAWARSGGMATFLQDPGNWKDGLNLDTYLKTPSLQDRAFRINAEHDYARAREQGILGDDDKPARIAGFLKAAHIAGFNSAREAMTGGRVQRDAAGVSNYDLIHDISRNRDGLDAPMRQALASPTPVAASPDAPAREAPATLADPAHPRHAQFREVDAALGRIPGFEDETARQRVAASILVAATAANLDRIDHVVPGAQGTLFAVRGDLHDPAHRLLPLGVAELAKQDIATSTAQLAALAPQPDMAAEAQRQERGRTV
jgi:hypothetical protein